MSKKRAHLMSILAMALMIGVAGAADKDGTTRTAPEAKRPATQDLPCAEDPPVKTDLKKKSATRKSKAATATPAKP